MSLADVKKAAQEMIEEMEADPETGEKPVEVTTGPKGVTIGISSDISFSSGSANLKPEIVNVLDKIVPTIESSYFMVAVEGHTDTDVLPQSIQSKYPSNWELFRCEGGLCGKTADKYGGGSNEASGCWLCAIYSERSTN